MSPTTLADPHRRRRSGRRLGRRLTALAVSLTLGAAGLAATAAPAYADAAVQIAGPADAVTSGTAYTYTVTVQNVVNDVGLTLTLDLTGSNATITAADDGGFVGGCDPSGASAYCEVIAQGTVTFTFTVVPTESGTVTATATAGGDANGTDSTDTTIVPSPLAPTVTSVSPADGPAAGGTVVTITGTNLADTTAITFEPGNYATDISCTADSCTATTPPEGDNLGTATADVVVIGPNGASDLVLADEFTYFPGIAIDQTVTGTGAGTVDSAPFSTTGPRLLVALTSSDGPATKQTTTVSGAGLTWTLARRADTKGGTAEIWTAYADGPLTDATVTSTPKTQGYAQLLTVEVLTGASGTTGAAASAGKSGGAPSVTLTATAPGSQVFAVGEDYTRATTVTPGPGQALLQHVLDTANNDTFWVQAQTADAPAAGTTVTVNDTAPTGDTWNFAAVEVLPAVD